MNNNQLCNVVMLPTNQQEAPFWIDEFNVLANKPGFMATDERNYQHLYITSHEEIKKGDYYYDKEDKLIFLCKDNQEAKARNDYRTIYNQNRWFKVLATTDKNLEIHNPNWKQDYVKYGLKSQSLPQIPESFIKAFVNSQGTIAEVLVEYRHLGGTGSGYVPKLREDNTTIIHPAKTYTTADMKVAMATYCRQNNMMDKYDSIALFIEQNL